MSEQQRVGGESPIGRKAQPVEDFRQLVEKVASVKVGDIGKEALGQPVPPRMSALEPLQASGALATMQRDEPQPHAASVEAVSNDPAKWSDFDEFLRSLQDASLASPSISPQRFSSALSLGVQELAQLARVHRNTVARAPESPALQSFMRESVRVIRAAADVFQDIDSALFWFRNEPLSDFDYNTPIELVAAGRSRDVVAYVSMLEAGFLG